MKLVLTIFGLMVVLVFGIIATVGDSSTTSVVTAATAGCHDDGDDDAPGYEEEVDGPDEEENDEENQNGRDEEFGDSEEGDPAYEEDDDVGCQRVEVETLSPSPTCPPISHDGLTGEECCPLVPQGSDFFCICPDSADGEVSEEAIPCSCALGAHQCLCEYNGDEYPNVPQCCEYFGSCQISAETWAADADCDGEVTPVDAYETLVVLSGFESSAGPDCGGGDADCSDSVDARDTLAILAVVAGLEEAAAC